MDNIHSINLPSWETGLHLEGILYLEVSNLDLDLEINIIYL
jgi:hypothetical protein